jgi:hypothetical protein
VVVDMEVVVAATVCTPYIYYCVNANLVMKAAAGTAANKVEGVTVVKVVDTVVKVFLKVHRPFLTKLINGLFRLWCRLLNRLRTISM